MKKTILSFALLGLILLAGCSQLPQEQIDAARASLENAKASEAGKYVPEALKAALQKNEELTAELANQEDSLFKSYGRAEEIAKELLDASLKADEDARQAKENGRIEAQKVPIPKTELNPNQLWEPQAKYLLLSGWSASPEGELGQKYVWAVGERSSVQFWLDKSTMSGRLEFTAFPVTGPGIGEQKLEVWLNGQRVEQVVIEPRERPYVMELPAAAFKVGKNQFDLVPTVFASPKDMGTGADVRKLSVLFKRIALVTN